MSEQARPEQSYSRAAVQAAIDTTGWGSAGIFIPRVARKRHECEGDGSASHRHAHNCPRVIEPGDGYAENVSEAAGYRTGSPTTVECLLAFWTESRRS